MTAGRIAALAADKMAAEAPLGGLGADEDLKSPVVLLASEAGRQITGQTLAVDGGQCAI